MEAERHMTAADRYRYRYATAYVPERDDLPTHSHVSQPLSSLIYLGQGGLITLIETG